MPINAADYFRRKQIFDQPDDPRPQNVSQLGLKVPKSDLMSRITRGNGEGTPYPTSGGVNLPPADVSLEVPSGLPEMSGRGDEAAALANRAPFRLGVPETGALGNVEARQQANDLGLPSSGVRNGAILPPKMHHGFWDRLKQAGEGAVIGMGRQAEQNARSGREQSLESLLGAGAAGGVVGGASPLTIDAWKNAAQAQRDEQGLAAQQGLEGQRAQIDELRRRAKAEDPAKERERDDVRAVYQALLTSGQDFSADNPEHKAIHDRAAALGVTLPYGKKAASSRNAQTGSVSEGGVKYQTERDDSGRWVKSVGADGKPIVLDEKPRPVDVGGQNAPDIRGLEERIGGYQTELKSHEDEIATKNAAIRTQAEADYQAARKQYEEDVKEYNKPDSKTAKPVAPKRKDFYDNAQNNDKDYLDGTVKKVNTRIKELKDAIKEESGNLSTLKKEVRTSEQKPRVGLNATEQKIYDAAKAKGLDPDEAVRRYKTGKY